ncbi:MAG: PKD domain-containing protein [Bacteroidia bacterium]
MVKITRPTFFICVALLLAGLFFVNPYSVKKLKPKTVFENLKEQVQEEGGLPLRDRMDLAMKQEFELTKDPAINTVPRERLINAYYYAEQLRAQSANGRVMGAIPGMNWVERGPNNCGGRTRAIMIDPSDATKKTAWCGGVGGGLWKTTDITVAAPAWISINDLFANLAITSICSNPASTQIMYFGTGEGYYNADAIRGNGIWKSADGGATWSQLAATTGLNYYYINRVIVHPTGDVYTTTRSGLFRSQDAGVTWNRVLGSSAPGGAVTDNFSDVEIAADNSIWASTLGGNGGIYRSANGNAGTWTILNTGANGFPSTGFARVDIACAPNNAAVCYAFVESGSTLLNFYKTTNTGASWTTLTRPVDADGGIGNDLTRGQAWYDMSIAVDPNNSNTLFVGGVDLFKSSNGGTSWQQVSHWYGGFGFQNVHADQHIVLFEPGNSNVCYFGNDGGIWRTSNATAAIPTISSRHDNYNVTQFYACAMNPGANSNNFLAGSQDNGSHRYLSAGMNATTQPTGGDGMFCHIDQDQPQYQFTSYVYSNYYRSTNTGASFSTLTSGNNNGSFVNPTDYDNAANNLYACYTNGNYSRILNAPVSNTLTSIAIAAFNGGKVTHVSCSQNTTNKVFFGINNGRVVRVDNADQAAPTGVYINSGFGMPGTSVSCIAIENGNDNHLLVTYSSYGVNSVWETSNGGTSWTSVEGNIPDIPVRWALFNPLINTQAVLATELGAWSTDLLSGAATNWAPSNTGLANVSTHMMQIRSSDNMVIAATHGRGLYSCDVFSPPNPDFIADKKIRYTSKTIQFTDVSTKATSWLWNFGDATTSTLQNPTKTYSNMGTYTVTLQINGNPVYTATKVAYIQILPNRGTPYAPAAGGNFDLNFGDFGPDNIAGTLWQRGNSASAGKNGTFSGANVWVTGLAGNYLDNTDASLMTPNYNFTTAGAYTLKLYRKNSFEIGWDGFRVEYSLDKGDTWASLGNVAAGWYDFANTTQNTSFPINEPYFNSTIANFTLASWNVSAFAGNPNVAFRMHFQTDANTGAPGVAMDDFEIVGPTNSPLPVELLSFTGKAGQDFNLLNWKTASENNNKGFDVERSAPGEDFQKIGFANGNGNSTGLNEYRFEDRNSEKNIYYYRLKQFDFNGNYKYSNVIAIRRESVNNSGVESIYPNPLLGQLNIILNAELENDLAVSLYDINGKKIFSKNIMPENFSVNINLIPFNLAQGMYLIYIVADEKIYSQKLFKK